MTAYDAITVFVFVVFLAFLLVTGVLLSILVLRLIRAMLRGGFDDERS